MRNGDRSTPATRRILDVGCGQNKFPGAIGIDANPRSHADVIHDLGVFPYPFANDEFDEIVCRHVIEHVPDVLGFVTELHRITKPGGRLKIVTPHYSNPDWATDPTHRNHFNSYSFTCFVPTRTPFPFYTTAELKPVTTHVSLANLWRAVGLEFFVNLDQRWPISLHPKILGVLSFDHLPRQGTPLRIRSCEVTLAATVKIIDVLRRRFA